MTRIDLAGAAWRKSSYSNGQGGNCVEVAVVPWRKSSYSNSQAQCVEVAALGSVVGLRDSKDVTGPALQFTPADFHAFLTALKSNTLR